MTTAWTSLKSAWLRLQARERQGLRVAASVLALYAVWALWLGPAWRVLQAAPAQHQALDAALSRMVQLQSEVQALRSLSPTAAQENVKARLERSLNPLGDSAKLEAQGEQWVVTLKNVAPATLALWLKDLHQQALPVQSAQLSRASSGTPLWSGSVTLKDLP